MTDKIVVLSTCATKKDAEKLARALLEERLAACVTVVPRVRSYYHWKGAIEETDEFLLVIKSSREMFAGISSALEKFCTAALRTLLRPRTGALRGSAEMRPQSRNHLRRCV